MTEIENKIITPTQWANTLSEELVSNKLVFTNGCFDILHYGHIKLLETASGFGDILIVGLNSDSSVKSIKGSDRPFNNEIERAYMLASLSVVSYVILFHEDTPLNLIKSLKPDILVKGGDWDEKDIVGSEFLKSYGGIVKSVPFIKSHSTTSIADIIKKL